MTTKAQAQAISPPHWAALFVMMLLTISALAELLVGSKPVLLSAHGHIYVFPTLSSAALHAARTSAQDIDWAIWPLLHTRSTLDATVEGWRALLEWWVYATRYAVSESVIIALLASTFGLALGWIATLAPRLCDFALRHAVALSGSLPSLALVGVVRVSGLVPAGLDLALVLIVLRSVETAHLVRTLLLSMQEGDFVTAARATGGSRLHILRWHLLPHLMRPLASLAATTLAHVVALEAGLSLVGLGAPKLSTWGGSLVGGGSALTALLALLTLASATVASIALARQIQRDRWVERHHV